MCAWCETTVKEDAMFLARSWISRICKFAQGDLNYWISPSGDRIPAPGASHSAVAAQILEERDGVKVDPTEAYMQLIGEGWIRISDFMFELAGHDESKKALIKSFMEDSSEYYDTQPTIEIDDHKGEQRQVSTQDYMKGIEGIGEEMPVAGYNPPPSSSFYSRWGD